MRLSALRLHSVGSEVEAIFKLEWRPRCFIARDANGQAFSYVYFEEESWPEI
jgi:hypothetical protein